MSGKRQRALRFACNGWSHSGQIFFTRYTEQKSVPDEFTLWARQVMRLAALSPSPLALPSRFPAADPRRAAAPAFPPKSD